MVGMMIGDFYVCFIPSRMTGDEKKGELICYGLRADSATNDNLIESDTFNYHFVISSPLTCVATTVLTQKSEGEDDDGVIVVVGCEDGIVRGMDVCSCERFSLQCGVEMVTCICVEELEDKVMICVGYCNGSVAIYTLSGYHTLRSAPPSLLSHITSPSHTQHTSITLAPVCIVKCESGAVQAMAIVQFEGESVVISSHQSMFFYFVT
jgi:hypothetical protein